MPDLAKLNPHSEAILDLLDAELKTFDAGGPDLDDTPGGKGWGWQGNPGTSTFKPYYILFAIPGGIFDGPLGCPSDDASLIYQVTVVGGTARQCEAAADRCNEVLVEQPLTVAGRYVPRITADMAGGGVRIDDTVQPPVFIATPRYRVDSVPGGS